MDYSKILTTIIAGEPRGVIVMENARAKPKMVVEFGIIGDIFRGQSFQRMENILHLQILMINLQRSCFY